jgi:prepilin-type N-terminal cleavage/methylation domain-containing protein
MARKAFTLVEILIVVIIMGILAMIIVPRYTQASGDARESSVRSDVQTVRSQIEVYRAQHSGRGPHLDSDGSLDTANMTARLLGQTDESGKLGAGTLGPYLRLWPENPCSDKSVAASVAFGAAARPPRDASTGWYYSTTTGTFSANSTTGAVALDPLDSAAAEPAVAEPSIEESPFAAPLKRF